MAGEAAAGIQRVALDTGLPVTFGVITALTEEQAWARAGGAVGNRGEEAAEAAVEMAAFVREHGARRGGGGVTVTHASGAAPRSKMGKRRKAREVALQFLYQLDVHGAE